MRTCENKGALPNFLRLRRRPKHEAHITNPVQRDIIPVSNSEERTRLVLSGREWPIESPNPHVRRRIHGQYEKYVVSKILEKPMNPDWNNYGERKKDSIGLVFPLFARAKIVFSSSAEPAKA